MAAAQRTITIGTRGSALAMAQTGQVVSALETQHPGITVRVERIRTAGDRDRTSSLRRIGGQGVFVKEIERALLQGEIDLAVHSLKDVPGTVPVGLTLAAFLPREDPRDALISRAGHTLAELPSGSRVGTSSTRRRAQLCAARPDLVLLDLRGNVDTRLRKVNDGAYDAIVLAVAGLRRLDLADAITQILPIDTMLPAPGQGAVVVQTRTDDGPVLDLVTTLDDPRTHAAVTAERAVLRVLGVGCRLPVGAYATVNGGSLHLRGLIGDEETGQLLHEGIRGPTAEAEALGEALARELLAKGAMDLLGTEAE